MLNKEQLLRIFFIVLIFGSTNCFNRREEVQVQDRYDVIRNFNKMDLVGSISHSKGRVRKAYINVDASYVTTGGASSGCLGILVAPKSPPPNVLLGDSGFLEKIYHSYNKKTLQDPFVIWNDQKGRKYKDFIVLNSKRIDLVTAKDYAAYLLFMGPNGALFVKDSNENYLCKDIQSIDYKAIPTEVAWDQCAPEVTDFDVQSKGNGCDITLRGKVSGLIGGSDQCGFILVKKGKCNPKKLIEDVLKGVITWDVVTIANREKYLKEYGCYICPKKAYQPISGGDVVCHLERDRDDVITELSQVVMYVIKGGKHYYISQLKSVIPDDSEVQGGEKPALENCIPLSPYKLEFESGLCSVKIEKCNITDVTLHDFCISYTKADDTYSAPPSSSEYVLMIRSDKNFNLGQYEQLLGKQSQHTNYCAPDDSFCIIRIKDNVSQKGDYHIPKDCLSFFNDENKKNAKNTYYACAGLYTKDKKLIYTDQLGQFEIEAIPRPVVVLSVSEIEVSYVGTDLMIQKFSACKLQGKVDQEEYIDPQNVIEGFLVATSVDSIDNVSHEDLLQGIQSLRGPTTTFYIKNNVIGFKKSVESIYVRVMENMRKKLVNNKASIQPGTTLYVRYWRKYKDYENVFMSDKEEMKVPELVKSGGSRDENAIIREDSKSERDMETCTCVEGFPDFSISGVEPKECSIGIVTRKVGSGQSPDAVELEREFRHYIGAQRKLEQYYEKKGKGSDKELLKTSSRFVPFRAGVPNSYCHYTTAISGEVKIRGGDSNREFDCYAFIRGGGNCIVYSKKIGGVSTVGKCACGSPRLVLLGKKIFNDNDKEEELFKELYGNKMWEDAYSRSRLSVERCPDPKVRCLSPYSVADEEDKPAQNEPSITRGARIEPLDRSKNEELVYIQLIGRVCEKAGINRWGKIVSAYKQFSDSLNYIIFKKEGDGRYFKVGFDELEKVFVNSTSISTNTELAVSAEVVGGERGDRNKWESMKLKLGDCC